MDAIPPPLLFNRPIRFLNRSKGNKSRKMIEKGCVFRVNLGVRDYQIKGGYVMVCHILNENDRKRLQNIKAYMGNPIMAVWSQNMY